MISLSTKATIVLLCAIVFTNASHAQINLKGKFEKKADQAIDDFLFGKKKDEPSTTNDTQASNEYSASNSSNESGSLGNYSRESVNYGSLSASQVVNFRDLINFLPDQFGGYSLYEKPEGATTRYGEFTYSTGAKNYKDGNKELSASIFDYLKVGALLSGYVNQYEYESSEGIMKSIEVKGQPGWFTANYESGETSMTLIANDRFLIVVAGEGLDESTLRGYFSTMDIERLPNSVETEEE